MKIIHVVNMVYRIARDGSGSYSHNIFLHEGFEQLGHTVLWYAPSIESDQTSKSLSSQRTIYTLLKRLMPRSVALFARDLYIIIHNRHLHKTFARLLSDAKPDFVYERYTDYSKSCFQACHMYNVPYVVEMHDPPMLQRMTQRLAFPRYNRRTQRYIAQHADKVVVVSKVNKNELISEGVSAQKILVVPNAVAPELFHPFDRRVEIRQKLNLAESVVLGFVGTMKSYHGCHLLPDVCEILRRAEKNIVFLLVGKFSDDEYKLYTEELHKRKISSAFVFTGGVPVQEVPGYIEAMDIALMPDSNAYGSPIKLFEYGALGKPVVMPRYAPIEEIVEDGRNGLLFQPGSPKDMAEKILCLTNDENLRERLGNTLQQDVLANHTWKANAEKIVQAIQEDIPARSS